MERTLNILKKNKLSSLIFNSREIKIDETMIQNVIRPRSEEGYKGDYGRVFIIAGSKGYAGAAYLTAQAAVRSGAGLVTLCTPKELQDIMSVKLTEAMTLSYEDTEKINNIIAKSNVIAIGPGMGNSRLTYNILSETILKSDCPIVIDADGLNVLQNNLELLQCKNHEVILTPHYGEMARLTGLTVDEVKEDKLKIAKKFAKDNDIILLLKGHRTIITDGEYVFINTTGNSAMASGGMGDTLTGIIASFIAQGYEPLVATYLATYVHGYCGDKLAEDMFCVNASHLIQELPFIIKDIMRNK
ncbi:NAD(P)H-hydrate dehydratase [Clostridium sp. UBA4548]|uniref:NAD(P)H-hydrate dehydratase n=1 Tax=Clostridium sp. UBA4548 TaxID=1946361 RepID=UPI0025C5AD75|nr:NAD(P)H-hydrate dehydratase [Clostridium sp. UBA4548]